MGEGSGFNIRATPVLYPFFFFLFYLDAQQNSLHLYSKQKLIFLSTEFLFSIGALFFVAFPLHLEFVTLNTSSSLKILILLAFNLLYFTSLYVIFLGQISSKSMLKVISIQIYLIALIIVFQLFLALVGFYQPLKFGLEGWLNLGRPSAFFDDVGWLGIWVFGLLCVYIGILKSLNQIQLPTMTNGGAVIVASFVIALISQSRILFLLIASLILISYKFNPKIIAIISSSLFCIFAVIFFGSGLSENLYYDLIDFSKNPRLNDFFLVVDELESRDSWWFGLGLGGGEILNETYAWRNMSSTLNVLPLSMVLETGLSGLILFALIISGLFRMLQNKHSKTSFVLLVFALIFHNAIHKHFFWLLLAMIFWLDKVISARKQLNAQTQNPKQVMFS